MVRDSVGTLRFGMMEWVGLLTFRLMLLGSVASSVSVLWHYSDRVLVLEQQQATTVKSLEEIRENAELIPRIDQRVMALEAAGERRERP